ncbi:MAG: hypothetical protein NPIRA04_15210 [Nitrospirales bacterium]|nr:MAG: hypothetical protein NPIRA04_15210 [Nitrospirales bacterium]
MSFPNKYTLSLTQEAESDFVDILVYTAQEWGQEKLKEYDGKLEKGTFSFLDMLCTFLSVGTPEKVFCNACSRLWLIIFNKKEPFIT